MVRSRSGEKREVRSEGEGRRTGVGPVRVGRKSNLSLEDLQIKTWNEIQNNTTQADHREFTSGNRQYGAAFWRCLKRRFEICVWNGWGGVVSNDKK